MDTYEFRDQRISAFADETGCDKEAKEVEAQGKQDCLDADSTDSTLNIGSTFKFEPKLARNQSTEPFPDDEYDEISQEQRRYTAIASDMPYDTSTLAFDFNLASIEDNNAGDDGYGCKIKLPSFVYHTIPNLEDMSQRDPAPTNRLQQKFPGPEDERRGRRRVGGSPIQWPLDIRPNDYDRDSSNAFDYDCSNSESLVYEILGPGWEGGVLSISSIRSDLLTALVTGGGEEPDVAFQGIVSEVGINHDPRRFSISSLASFIDYLSFKEGEGVKQQRSRTSSAVSFVHSLIRHLGYTFGKRLRRTDNLQIIATDP